MSTPKLVQSILPSSFFSHVEIVKREKRQLDNAELQASKKARREKNLEVWGDNCDLEYRMLCKLKAGLCSHGIEVLILNDYTLADCLVRRVGATGDEWLPVQVKTTHGQKLRKDSKKFRWRFSNMMGYEGMPVLCCVEASEHRWIANGNIFKVKDIDMAAGTKYDKASLRVDKDSQLAAALIAMMESGEYSLTKKWDARLNIKRQTHQVEMQSILLWLEHVCSPNQWEYRWPNGTGLAHDLEFRKSSVEPWKRIQFKTVRSHRSIGTRAAGFTMGLQHQAGYNSNGKPTHKPYSVGDADVYVGMTWDDSNFDVWTFEESHLAHYLASELSTGKTSMTVLLPSALTNEHVNDGRQGSKGGPKNQAVWTRLHHCRFARL